MPEREDALTRDGVPRTPEDLAAHLEASEKPDEALSAWDARVREPVSEAAHDERDAPAALLDAARALEDGRDDAIERVDHFVTSRGGFRQMLRGLYRITREGDEWDERRLRDELSAGGARPECAARIADRACDVGRVVTFSDGPARRDVLQKLARTEALSAGARPYRPIGVPVTKHPQRQVRLPVHGDVEVRCVDVNPSAPDTILLIPGHAARLEQYEQLIDALDAARPGQNRILALDLPGCGYSDKPDVDYSIDDYEPTLVSFLDALGVSKCVVAGGGLGGNLTLRLAYRYPKIVRHAVAWSIAGWGETNHFLSLSARAFASAPAFLFWTVAKRQLEEQLATKFDGRDALFEEELAYRREVYERNFHKAYFHIASDQVGTSMREHARAIEPPVTLLAGAKDRGRLDIRGAVEDLALHMGLEAVLLSSGYALMNEKPEALAEHVLAPLDG